MLLVYTPFPPPPKKMGGKLRRIMVSVKMVNSFPFEWLHYRNHLGIYNYVLSD